MNHPGTPEPCFPCEPEFHALKYLFRLAFIQFSVIVGSISMLCVKSIVVWKCIKKVLGVLKRYYSRLNGGGLTGTDFMETERPVCIIAKRRDFHSFTI